MEQGLEISEQSHITENHYEVRLMSLLRDLVKEKGRMGAARVLGVDHRTVTACVEGGKLSKRVRGALEFVLLTGADPEAARQREHIEALERRVDELEDATTAGQAELRKAIEDAVTGLREDHSRALEHIEKRLAVLEAGMELPGSSKQTTTVRNQSADRPAIRQYTEIVTLEPEPDEEQVYGDVIPLIVEWRRVRSEVLAGGDSRSARNSVYRLRELEIVLIRDYGLTLPPALYPWDQFQKRDELDRRTKAIEESRVNGLVPLIRKWLRRLMSTSMLDISP